MGQAEPKPCSIWKSLPNGKTAAENAYDYFVKRFKTQQYKRLTMPEGVKVFEVSLSPRSDVKIPGDMH